MSVDGSGLLCTFMPAPAGHRNAARLLRQTDDMSGQIGFTQSRTVMTPATIQFAFGRGLEVQSFGAVEVFMHFDRC